MSTDADWSADDKRYMAAALGLAKRGLGRVAPNPTVGCLIVKDGHIVGRGWTQPGGRPHGEAEALRRAGSRARGATVYVSLEPCCHWGKAPPCADALVAAGVKRVVIACPDPDPRVNGGGIRRLREADIEVNVGLMADAARSLNSGFFRRIQEGRPEITLKLATSLDGRLATMTGESKWITGALARRKGHLLRATHDAIMIGSRTARIDDPMLTCRIPGLEDRSPTRIVIDSRLQIDLSSQLAKTATEIPTIVVTREDVDHDRAAAFEQLGLVLVKVPADSSGVPVLPLALKALGTMGLTRVLVEGGSRLAASLLQEDLVDRMTLFQAPMLIGEDGVSAIDQLGIDRLADSPRFVRVRQQSLGPDTMTELIRQR